MSPRSSNFDIDELQRQQNELMRIQMHVQQSLSDIQTRIKEQKEHEVRLHATIEAKCSVNEAAANYGVRP